MYLNENEGGGGRDECWFWFLGKFMFFGGVLNRCVMKLDDSLSGCEELISEFDKRFFDENFSENGYCFMEMEVLE